VSYNGVSLTASLGLDPFDELLDVDVDSRFLTISTADTPADDALQPPVTDRMADERTTRVALARVPASGLVAGTDHVLVDAIVEVAIALGPVDDWYHDLAKSSVVTCVCNDYNKR